MALRRAYAPGERDALASILTASRAESPAHEPTSGSIAFSALTAGATRPAQERRTSAHYTDQAAISCSETVATVFIVVPVASHCTISHAPATLWYWL